MPFGTKKDPGGGPDIDFDAVYEQGIQPAIGDAGMEAVRADEERTGGIIHKAMFERLLLCDYAVADLTAANANVYYELGVRHAVRPATTLPIFAERQKLLFDVEYLRALPYKLGENNRFTAQEAGLLRSALAGRLRELREMAKDGAATDSPISKPTYFASRCSTRPKKNAPWQPPGGPAIRKSLPASKRGWVRSMQLRPVFSSTST
jgi:hypothetical protein